MHLEKRFIVLINRRSILNLFGGGAAAIAVAPQESVKSMAKSLGISDLAAVMPTEINNVLCNDTGSINSGYSPYWELVSMLNVIEDTQRTPINNYPSHIRNKKSWSDVYKSHEFTKEVMIRRAWQRKMESDEYFRKNVMNILGIKQE